MSLRALTRQTLGSKASAEPGAKNTSHRETHYELKDTVD